MLRVGVHLMTLLSMALMALSAVLWVRSHREPEEWRWRVRQGVLYERLSIRNEGGMLGIKRYRLTQPPGDQSGPSRESRWGTHGLHFTCRVVRDTSGMERWFI